MNCRNINVVKMAYRPDIDALRAIAVLAVVGFHAFPSKFKGGFVGVDVFFVISGYLISKIIFDALDSHSFSFATFYAKRVRRIFPALVFMLAIILPLGYILLLPDEYSQLGKHVFSGSMYISNFTLLNESGYFDRAAETKLLLHLWSLAIEEQFYILWPLGAFLIHKFVKRRILFVFILLVASFMLHCIINKASPSTAFYLPFTRSWELLVGALLTLLERSADKRIECFLNKSLFKFENHTVSVKKFVSFISVLLIVLAIMLIQPAYSFLGSILATFSAAMLLFSKGVSFINNKVFIAIGIISYPLYLWHWPLLSFGRIYEGIMPGKIYRIAAVCASFLLAGFTYTFVERYLRFGKHLCAKTGLLVVGLCFIGICGAYVANRQGFPERIELKEMENNLKNLEWTKETDREGIHYVDYNGQLPPFPYCKFSDAASQETVAIIGDSHAHTAFPGLATAINKVGFNVVLMANSSCPPLLGAPTGITTSKQQQCEKQIKAILNTVVKKDDIKDVLIFTRGPIYYTGISIEISKPSRPPEMDMKTFFEGLQSTINYLNKHGKRVFYITENPELFTDPRACLRRPFRSPQYDCSISKKDVEARQEQYIIALRKITGCTIIDTKNIFCPTDSCIAFSNGALLYADSDHLSVSGSEFLAKNILPELQISKRGR